MRPGEPFCCQFVPLIKIPPHAAWFSLHLFCAFSCLYISASHFSAPHTNVGQAVAAHDVECALRMLSKKQHGCAGESLFQHVHPSAEAPAAILAFVYSKVCFLRCLFSCFWCSYLKRCTPIAHVESRAVSE